ncbi:cyclic nucleotide-binding domain-containing protein [Clostridium sp. SM-530-WT-3G]|nr:cyclic nucleotide-binding domain-containing protein [Clostridium sp. SM-530-WT-3G]
MEGNKIKDLLFFVDGRIEIYNLSRNGNGFTIAYCEPLGFLGDMEYLAEIPTPNNVEALTTITCIAIPLKANKHILENDIKFYKFLSKTLVNKTLGLSQSICNEKVPSIEKLKSYLELIGKNHIIDTNLNEIAQSIGISYRQLMRHMNRLCEAGYLSKGEKKGVYIMK